MRVKSYLSLRLLAHLPTLPLLMHTHHLILTLNLFSFNSNFWLQCHETAMGTCMGPSYANIFMGWLEERLLSTSPWTVDLDLWRRFIDDILLLWLHGEASLLQFLDWLNQQHPTIKFTSEVSVSDVYLYKSENIDVLKAINSRKHNGNILLPRQ